jgi:hypothetical protein
MELGRRRASRYFVRFLTRFACEGRWDLVASPFRLCSGLRQRGCVLHTRLLSGLTYLRGKGNAGILRRQCEARTLTTGPSTTESADALSFARDDRAFGWRRGTRKRVPFRTRDDRVFGWRRGTRKRVPFRARDDRVFGWRRGTRKRVPFRTRDDRVLGWRCGTRERVPFRTRDDRILGWRCGTRKRVPFRGNCELGFEGWPPAESAGGALVSNGGLPILQTPAVMPTPALEVTKHL